MDDDEVEIVSVKTSPLRNEHPCGFCKLDLSNKTLDQRRKHYDNHFQDSNPSTSNTNAVLSPTSPQNRKRKRCGGFNPIKFLGNDVALDRFWYASLSEDPPLNFTPGLIPLIKKVLHTLHQQNKISKGYLCYDKTVHATGRWFDIFWACGYYNFVILCTALKVQPFQPSYSQLLSGPSPPGVRSLQRCIEAAWDAGYDKEGAEHLKKLIGTSKRIGTADLHVAFTYLGIPSRLVDFDLVKSRDIRPLLDWIVNYFSAPTNLNGVLQESSLVQTDRMPIILQYHGHSQTVIGYIKDRDQNITLLIFEPNQSYSEPIRKAALQFHVNSKKLVNRLSTNQLFHPGSSGGTGSHLPSRPKRERTAQDAKPEAISISDDSNTEDDEVVIVEHKRAKKSSGESSKLSRFGFTIRSPNKSTREPEPDPWRTLKDFRMNASQLKVQQYQILYFPMTPPLTDREKEQGKVVLSTQIP